MARAFRTPPFRPVTAGTAPAPTQPMEKPRSQKRILQVLPKVDPERGPAVARTYDVPAQSFPAGPLTIIPLRNPLRPEAKLSTNVDKWRCGGRAWNL